MMLKITTLDRTKELLKQAQQREGQYMADYVAPADNVAHGADGAQAKAKDDDTDVFGISAAVADLVDDEPTIVKGAHYHIMHNKEMRPSRADQARVRLTRGEPLLRALGAGAGAAGAAAAADDNGAGPATAGVASGGARLGPSAGASSDVARGTAAPRSESAYDALTDSEPTEDDDDGDGAEPAPPPVVVAQPPPAQAPRHIPVVTLPRHIPVVTSRVTRGMATMCNMTLLEFAQHVLTLDAAGRQALLDRYYDSLDGDLG
jgi:hypothetical protein